MWIVKVDELGDSLWSQAYGGTSGETINSIVSSGDGQFLLAGTTSSYGAGGGDVWLVKVDVHGELIWSQTYGGSSGEWANSVILSQNGDYLAAGVGGSFGAGGDDMWLLCVEGFSTPVQPETQPIHPLAFILYPSHPNPFNPTTALSFQLPVAGWVQLQIFDVNGRNVGARHAVPVGFGESNLQFYPPGTHHILFDGSGLPSGIYFARLQAVRLSRAGDFTQTQKLVYLK